MWMSVVHKFLLFCSNVRISSCISELASQPMNLHSKCWFSTFHKHHTTLCLSFLLSLFNSVLVNTQWRRTTRQVAPKSWQWRAETWCSWSSRETMDSGEKTSQTSPLEEKKMTAAVLSWNLCVCVCVCHAGLCVIWAHLRRAWLRPLISSHSLGSPSLASLSPAQVLKHKREQRTDVAQKCHISH